MMREATAPGLPLRLVTTAAVLLALLVAVLAIVNGIGVGVAFDEPWRPAVDAGGGG